MKRRNNSYEQKHRNRRKAQYKRPRHIETCLQHGGHCANIKHLRGGNTEVKILDLSKYRVRKLTPTEYGRLQAFPMDDWEQVVSDSQAYKQFGNAVTVNVVQAIAEQIKACVLATGQEEEITDLSDAPQEVKERILENDKLLKATEPIKPVQKRLSDYTDVELLEELMRRQACG
ncbi:MAG: DNA cytosine methyltransferase [Ruminococcus sp.]|nr:DNA cytosine methyltransferase [Ruminococcus sp.]